MVEVRVDFDRLGFADELAQRLEPLRADFADLLALLAGLFKGRSFFTLPDARGVDQDLGLR